MQELHTSGPWQSYASTEDYQGHFINGNGRIVAATFTQDACNITKEDAANASLIVAAPIMLQTLRQIAHESDFCQEDGAMELGQRLIEIERGAKVAIALYEAPVADWSNREEEDADE